MNDDLISRQWLDDAVPRTSVEYICRKNTVSTNPYEHKYHDKFIQFMDDPEISDFGRWQYSNGFNTALVAVKCDLDKVPSVQKEHTETHSCDCERTETHDLVSRRSALEAMDTWDKFGCDPDGKLVRYDKDNHYTPYVRYEDMVNAVKNLPSQPESRREWYMKGYRDAQRWIPFETRELDAEEKQEHPEWDFVLCGKLPQDGQRILVNIKYKGHEAVQMDEYNDDGRECYLYSGYDIATEATAWMPLPEPYAERKEDE